MCVVCMCVCVCVCVCVRARVCVCVCANGGAISCMIIALLIKMIYLSLLDVKMLNLAGIVDAFYSAPKVETCLYINQGTDGFKSFPRDCE